MRISGLSALVLAASVAGCSAVQSFMNRPPRPTVTVTASQRPKPYPVFETRGFARAVQNGTRTRTGEPGPNYWQQFARYKIDAELVPAMSQLTGRETVRYFNRS